MEKFCCKCNVEKPLSEFHKDSSRADGHQASCKTCRHAWYVEHRKKIIARASERYWADKAKAFEL